ncbi:DUF4012 domain-containing protein [Streptomyces sp. 7N604]|uniref:DUF4012 domain-containing protein n=1 Tax=Streptomyces sp. 7N604 TaxID=3457415 RepID=UPI003FD53B26
MTDKHSEHTHPNRRRRRRLLAGLATAGLFIAALAGWLAMSGLEARTDLTVARAAVGRLRADLVSGNLERAERELAIAQRRAASARRNTSGPVWAIATRLPFVDRPTRTVRELASAADRLTHDVLPALTQAAQRLQRAASPGRGATVDLADLRAVPGRLADAAHHVKGIREGLSAAPAHTGIAGLNRARTELAQDISRLDKPLATAADVSRLLPRMLGAERPRRYFVALQTNAEARGTGGLVGAFGVLTADNGRLRFEDFASNEALPRAPEPVADLGRAFDLRYSDAKSTQLLANSNLSPHYPYAARIWTELWRHHTGRRADGAIATDPVGLATLLTATGPVPLPDGRQLTAANALDLTERQLYTDYPDKDTRKKALTRVAKSVGETLLHRRPNTSATMRALTTMAADGRLRVWSRHVPEQRQLATTPLGGVLPDTAAPFAYLVVNNAAASKLDYYLGRSLDYRLGPCQGTTRHTRVRIRLTNTAPARGLPDYVVYRGDAPHRTHIRGSNLAWASLYATRGAQLIKASIDGRTLLMSVHQERNHPVFSATVEIRPGRTRTLDLQLLEPASGAPPLTPAQPLARPQSATVSVAPCRTNRASPEGR